MFQRLSSLLFGWADNSCTDPAAASRAGEVEVDGWLLVSLPGGEASAEPSPLVDVRPSTSACRSHTSQSSRESSVVSLVSDASMSEPEVPVPRSSLLGRVTRAGQASQAAALVKVTQVARVQRAHARADRRHLGRHCMQRQNCVRQRQPRHPARARPTFLHQPGHRNCSH